MNKRILALLLPLLGACSGLTTDHVELDATAAAGSFYALNATDLNGADQPLSVYEGKVVLVVNTASKCGFTSQYEGLQTLQEQYAYQGFSVLGFPSGDFGGQEFPTAVEIRTFCTENYEVSFPLFAKTNVKVGEDQSPIYQFLGKATGNLPGWNFGKYLVNRDGKVLAFYASPVEPTSKELRSAIESALASSKSGS